MKYVQPWGVSDPEAAYINGNPSTGTMGSIPPAASIEHPQREVVNLIKDAAAVVPIGTDLHQLGKSIQSGKLNYGTDTGTAGAAIVALVPIPDAYYIGMQVTFKAVRSPAGPTTLDAGRGARPIARSGGVPLAGGEWSVGDLVSVMYDGSFWQLPTPSTAMLFGPRDYYVSTTGNDSNDGLTAGTAFRTLQKAQDTLVKYNQNGFLITVHVADGTYDGVQCGQLNGTGGVAYVGNTATPASCIVTSTVSAGHISGPCFTFHSGEGYSIDGFKLAAGTGAQKYGVYALVNTQLHILNVEFATCLDSHIVAEQAAQIGYGGPITISGNSANHIQCVDSSYVRETNDFAPPSLNITAPVNIGCFVNCGASATVFVVYSGMLGYANVTGQKFSVIANGVINTNGRGVNYYPGGIAGGAGSGGQYM